ncbi:hypothetical protein BHM03_00060463, partial [Ensete ventricosum]
MGVRTGPIGYRYRQYVPIRQDTSMQTTHYRAISCISLRGNEASPHLPTGERGNASSV